MCLGQIHVSSVKALCLVFIRKTDEENNGFALCGKLCCLSCKGRILLCLALLELVALCKFNVVADILKLFKSVVELCGVDVRGACALVSGCSCKLADNCNLAFLLKGKNAVVLEKHHTVCGNFSCEILVIKVVVGIVFLCACSSLVNELEYVECSLCYYGFVECAVLDSFNNLLCACTCGGGHFKVITVLEAENSVVTCAPVADYHAVKAPFVTENFKLCVLVFGAVEAVDFVVGVHNRPGLCLLDGNFKSGEVNFTQRSFVNNAVTGHSACFLAVCAEVLERSADTH